MGPISEKRWQDRGVTGMIICLDEFYFGKPSIFVGLISPLFCVRLVISDKKEMTRGKGQERNKRGVIMHFYYKYGDVKRVDWG